MDADKRPPGTHGHHRESHGCEWEPKDAHGRLREPIGDPWTPTVAHRTPLETHRRQRVSH